MRTDKSPRLACITARGAWSTADAYPFDGPLTYYTLYAAIAYMRSGPSSPGELRPGPVEPRYLFIGSDCLARFSSGVACGINPVEQDLAGDLHIPDRYEYMTAGHVGTLLGLTVLTDHFELPADRFLDTDKFYLA